MFETEKINVSDLPIFADLTIAEQEIVTGGQNRHGYRANPNGSVDSSYGDEAITPNGTRVIDRNPTDDPHPYHYPYHHHHHHRYHHHHHHRY
jgi:hypothetical protein